MGKKWDKLMARIDALEKALGLGGETPKASKPKKKAAKKKPAAKPAKPAPKPKKKAKTAKKAKALPPVPAIIPGL